MDDLLNHFQMISWPLLSWSGLAAYVLSTWVLTFFRKVNATRYLPRAYWSCAVTGGASDAALLLGGFIRMLALVGLIPIIYILIFSYTGKAEALMGLIVGAIHGALAGLVLPLAAKRCEGANPPGLLGWRLGRATPFVLLLVHSVYGATLGYTYVLTLP